MHSLAALTRAMVSVVLFLASASVAWGQTFTVTATPANTQDWTVNGQPDPTLVLERGRTYVFALNNVPVNHPFAISDDGINLYSNGVTNNEATGTTNVTFTVPLNAPATLYYVCTLHPEMIGQLTIVDAVGIFANGFEDPPAG